ncbi:5-carboxymethyl-2-hydroxymuconate Delta-isomerase [Aliiroseovarius subalbicans]|uniref:5-carboxymethyl-2-hydroxymuconate Delta-isomerase n=1 Tax=Aliiroseovarius subalbicans TaxID=2925840 RepID=UPI001F55E959|nr:5-carboxymethyl-2-hydroxymuconate Delta-isomerase [Aliiroseovarius subalbicans]MCI2397840.1 5-carboxymethyl-2-hydroxymuconate Delta-isomerase [Aliiroseovarius subalbicans]
MPHLSFEYSAGLRNHADLDALAVTMRDALISTGECAVGGIRVRGYRADVNAVGDGSGEYHFLDMVLRLGQGRDEATRSAIADQLYANVEAALRPQLGDMPFILSLEVQEIQSRFSRKSWSTIHAAIAKGTS